MGFEIVQRIRAHRNRDRFPVSISLGRGTPSGPSCYVGIVAPLARRVGFIAGGAVQVQVGNGEHAGLMRILPSDAAGIAAAKMTPLGGCTLNLGYIPQFGSKPQEVKYVAARIVDGEFIEVRLPWSASASSEVPAVASTPVSPSPAPKSVAPAAPPNPARDDKPDPGDIVVTVNRQDGLISYGGQAIKLTLRCARLAKALRAAYPSPVDRPFVTRKVFDSTSPQSNEALESVRSALNDAIRPMGLEARLLRGIGLQLVKADA